MNQPPSTTSTGAESAATALPKQSMVPKQAKQSVVLPAALADAALCSAEQAAAAAAMTVSTWYELIRTGHAPQPVVRRHRYTRWSVRQVVAFIETWTEGGTASPEAVAVAARSRKASEAAVAKLKASSSEPVPAQNAPIKWGAA
ncbi:MAG: hypothetical protein U1F56_01840 [Rubrivivax sp.]